MSPMQLFVRFALLVLMLLLSVSRFVRSAPLVDSHRISVLQFARSALPEHFLRSTAAPAVSSVLIRLIRVSLV